MESFSINELLTFHRKGWHALLCSWTLQFAGCLHSEQESHSCEQATSCLQRVFHSWGIQYAGGSFIFVPHPNLGRIRTSVNEPFWKGETLSMAEKTDSSSLGKYLGFAVVCSGKISGNSCKQRTIWLTFQSEIRGSNFCLSCLVGNAVKKEKKK